MANAAIVTGGSGGIGRAVAERLGADGFSVVVHYSGNKTKANEVVKAITEKGGKSIAVSGDISKKDDVENIFSAASEAFGTIGIVVNTAGIMPLAKIEQDDTDVFDRVIATNLRGTFLVMSKAATSLAKGGRIIVFSSSVIAKSFPTYGPYIASKAAVEGLVKVLANEIGERGITVNAVAPGPVGTELFLKGKSDEQISQMGKLAPLGRIGTPDDISGVVAFLAGKDGEWVNGQIIRVNGGFA